MLLFISRKNTCFVTFQVKALAFILLVLYNIDILRRGEKVKHAALIIDIKNSRKMDNEKRQDYQVKIKQTLDFLNDLCSKAIKYKVVFSLGDSVQGMFYSVNDAIGYFDLLKNLVYPLEIRCGIGYGEIYVDMEEFDSNMQDGPAYHNARSALDLCKDANLNLVIVDYRCDIFVNEIYKVIKIMENRGSNKRKDVYNLINMLYPYTFNKLNKEKYFQKIHTYILSNIHYYDKINVDNIGIKELANLDMEVDQKIKSILPDVSIPPSLSLLIGNILGTTRENIRQMIEVGEMNQIRNLKVLCDKFIKTKGS